MQKYNIIYGEVNGENVLILTYPIMGWNGEIEFPEGTVEIELEYPPYIYTWEEINNIKTPIPVEERIEEMFRPNPEVVLIAKLMQIPTNYEQNDENIAINNLLINAEIKQIENNANWEEWKKATVGLIVIYNNKEFICIQEHITQENWNPERATNLWKRHINPETEIIDWEPNIGFQIGNKCRYNGLIYVCIFAHTSILSWEPDRATTLWKREEA